MKNLNFFELEEVYDEVLENEERKTGVKTRLMTEEERKKYGCTAPKEREYVIKLTKIDMRGRNSSCYDRILYEDYIHFTIDTTKERMEKRAMFEVDKNRKTIRTFSYYEIAIFDPSKDDSKQAYKGRRDWLTHNMIELTGKESLY